MCIDSIKLVKYHIRGHELLASDSERARTYYHYACDEMGSITDITDCHGTVLNHYTYDAFGNRTVEEETVENRFGFAGEMLDAVTGQYYLRARFYNPVIARFLSEDTYYGDGLNLYAYCHNNPVGYVDPSGHEGLICSKKYGELKKKEAEGGTLSEKEKRQIYEYEQNQKKSNGAGSDSKSGSKSGSKPIGATYEGTIYRSVDSRYDPLEMSQYTINSNHRYTESGVPGLYFSSGEKIVKAELGNYDVFDFSNRTMYSYDVRLTNMLDVSNPSVRSQLGISLESIVGEGYDVTHAIGRYAYSNGYNGIIAPSARADGGINIILFNAKGVK